MDIQVNPGDSILDNKVTIGTDDYELDDDEFDTIEDWAEDQNLESKHKENDVSKNERESPALKGTLKEMMADQSGSGAGNGPPDPVDDQQIQQQKMNESSSIQMMADYGDYSIAGHAGSRY